ncbi:MAG: hypothetical protein IT317_04795 [Anaerolineales bacterium]|nr:hypothetical protein [Anaerolineales bacterium]
MKTSPDRNPRVGALLRVTLIVVVPVLLLSGGGLFFAPASVRPLWPWDISPFNAAFLGAFYLASAAGLTLAAWGGRWFPARIVTPMMFVFTATVLLVTLLELARFNFAHGLTYAWFVIFLGLPLASGVSLLRYRTWPAPTDQLTPGAWRSLLLALGAFYLLYGAGLFLFPAFVSAHWPWPLDAFHARAYSAIFTASAVALLGLAQEADPAERLALGLSAAALGLLAVFGLVIVNASRHTVAWTNPGVWLWLALFGVYFALGLGLIWWSGARAAEGRA